MRFLLRYGMFCSALLTFPGASWIQAQTLGTITGEVRDPSGSIVAGAIITVRNTETNGTRTATTNEDGIYSIPALNPGTYDVRAERSGFKSAARPGIQLQVQQTARIDFALELGQVSETIQVTDAPPLLTTETATVGTVIEQKRITDLPLNGRNFFSLVALSPNVTYGFTEPQQAAGRQGGTRSTLTMSLAGARSTWSNYTLDGITNTDINFNLYIVLPSVEALQEFKVQTGVYPAEFGREAGQVNVSTKGGTNEYHGAAFEFLRNDRLDARPYFFKDPESPNQTAPPKLPYRQNQYGFTLGGPVQIPKIINGKDKVFFLANYEGFKSRTTNPTYATVMTPAMRSGDFSVVTTQLFDPFSTVKNGTVTTRTPLVSNQVAPTRISTGSKYLLDTFVPLPNIVQSGLPNRNYLYNAKTPVDKDQFTGRIDFNQSSTSQWFGRYSWTDESSITPGLLLNGSPLYTRASQWVLANTHIVSPSTVNEIRFGYNSLYNNITQELANTVNVNEKLGTSIKVDDPNSWGIPQIGLGGGLDNLGNPTNGPFSIDNKVFQLVDNFSWIKGKHSLRFGGEWRYNQFLQIGNEFARSQFATNGQFTGDPTKSLAGGYQGADFLMGAFTTIQGAVALAKGDFRNTEVAVYIDDTYKLTPHLTVNLGLRWEFAQPLLDKFGNEPNIQLRQALPNIANVPDQSLHPVLVRTGNGDFYDGLAFRFNGPVQVARDGRLGDRLIKSDWNNYAPRIGVAYSPSSQWSIRAGFGVFFSQESKNSIFDMNRAVAGRVAPVIDASGIPQLTYNNYLDASALPARFTPGLTWGADYNLATSYTLQYLFNVQRALGKNSTVEVGYTGNQGRKLEYLINPNAAIPGITVLTQREPYPEWNQMQFIAGDGTSSYNAFSAKLSQRFGSHLTTLFSYTWAKALDTISSIRGTNGADFTIEDQRCRACSYGPSGFNIPHRFVSSILYSLPFGKDRRFANRGGVIDQIIGGWQVSTIATVQSGAPINPGAGWDAAGQGSGFPHSNRLNCVSGNIVAANPTTDAYWAGTTVISPTTGLPTGFIPDAFRNLTAGQYGTCGKNSLIGPSRWNVDFSTMKDFRFTEKHTLQFRMEMFNAPNHPAWNSPSTAFGNQNVTTANNGFGRVRGTSQLRQIQFALKYSF